MTTDADRDEIDDVEFGQDDFVDKPTPRWQKALAISIACVAIAATAFAVGRFTAFDSTPAAQVPTSSSADAGFARDMQVHHQQAVQLAMIIYPKTTDPDLRSVAYDMATSQAIQLGQMQQWLIDWNLPAFGTGQPMAWMAQASGHEDHGNTSLTPDEIDAAMGMATAAQVDELAAASGTQADCQFLSLMIRHHKGAIEMVDAIDKLGSNANVLDLAGKMAAAQVSEIEAMQMLQTRFVCSE